jgi:hypothetical protein
MTPLINNNYTNGHKMYYYGAMHLDTTNFVQTPNWQQENFIV